MEVIDLLRLVLILGLIYGAWRGWRALPSPVILKGKRYYRQPDGTYRTIGGRRVRDRELIIALAAANNEYSE